MAKAMKHKPRRLLCDANVLCELRAGDPFLVRSDEPNRHHPLAQLDLAVLKDRADLDRKPLPTVTALVRAPVAEMINAGAAT